jgi:hypothetical protein
MWTTTRVAGREVPVETGELLTVFFSSGRGGETEAGDWEFWTIFNDQHGSTARCRPGSDPGERFRRMEGVSGYERHWGIASSSLGVRPATQRELIAWLNSHSGDAQFAETCRVGAAVLRVVRNPNGLSLE